MKRVLSPTILAVAIATSSAGALGAGDIVGGERVFRKCAACHSVEENKNKVGPSLYGVVDRTPGTLEDYRYSAAMQAFGELGEVWDEATLNTYLEAPRKVVKGTRMSFPGLKSEQDRADVITYLRQFSE